MKILLPLLLLVAISASGLFLIGTDKTNTSSDADMLQLGNFAYQQQRYDDAIQWYTKAALQGKPEAQFQLSQMYGQGQAVDKDDILALNWMKKSAQNGLPKAEFSYANMLLFGKGLDQPNLPKAMVWLKKSAQHNHPKAMLKLAKAYFEGLEQTQNLYEALDWSLKAEVPPVTKTEAQVLRAKIVKGIKSQAVTNNNDAQYKLAIMYMHGTGVTEDMKQSQQWLIKAAKQNHIDAQYELGKTLTNDKETHKQAIYWLNKAAKQGHKDSGCTLASLAAQQPKNTPALNQEAWRWLYNGMREDDPKSLYNLAVILRQAKLGLPKTDNNFGQRLTFAADHDIVYAQNDAAIFHILSDENIKKNLAWLKKAGQADDALAQFNLGLLFARGESFSPSDEEALHWWKLSENNGNTKAQMLLGLFYHLGRGTGRSEQEAIKWYEKAGENGVNNALFNLAMIYHDGRGVDLNYKKAAFYLKKLADKNDAVAQNIYASLFLDGKGVTYSPEKAIYWFTRAAKLNDVNAMFNLATQYRKGNGVNQDDKLAILWYSEAAKQNFAPAQNALGYLYAEGRGTKKDADKAEEWFFKASDNGLRIADKNLDVLRHKGSFTLVTLQLDTNIRSDVLTNKSVDLASWLEVHHEPIL